MTIEDHFPEIYRRSNQHSIDWQSRYLWSERIQLASLLFAALFANLDDGGPALAALSFSIAIAAHLFRLITKADQKWWNGRAGAESTKTACWRYVVGGAPFPIGAAAADTELAARLTELASKVAEIVPVPVSEGHLTDEMRAARAQTLDDRIELYQRDRIRNQMRWYADHSTLNAERGRMWSWAAIASQAAGLIVGLGAAVNDWHFDYVGLLSAGAASAVAWVAVKQFEVLARSYAVASNELSSIDVSITATTRDEDDWSAFVNEAEEAISREHTSWRASRAV